MKTSKLIFAAAMFFISSLSVVAQNGKNSGTQSQKDSLIKHKDEKAVKKVKQSDSKTSNKLPAKPVDVPITLQSRIREKDPIKPPMKSRKPLIR